MLLEVKITEASKNFKRRLGVNLIGGKNVAGNKIGNEWVDNKDSSGRVVQTGRGGHVLGYVKQGTEGQGYNAG